MLNPISWQDFSSQYLPNVKTELSSFELSQSLKNYLNNVLPAESKLSTEEEIVLRNFAFKKTGLKGNKNVLLTNEIASCVFLKYQKTVRQLRLGYRVANPYLKPVKPKIPKRLSRLASISSSIKEQYLEPQYKVIVQNLLDQSSTVHHQTTPVFKDHHLNLNRLTTFEILAKKFAYLNPKSGEKFRIPFEGRMVEYEVEEIHLWMGMNAYGLRPVDRNEKANPILVFSGTRLSISSRGSMATLASDFDPRGVGHLSYMSGKTVISDWMNKVGGNVVTTGHSLGGALAQYAAIDNEVLVKEGITFSAPGISEAYANRWKALKFTDLHTPIYNFNHSEDLIPTFGQAYVGKHFKVICAVNTTVNKQLGAQRRIHSKLLFGNKKVGILTKVKPQRTMPIWKQRALSIIPFIFAITMVFLGRAFFGLYTSKPHVSVFGPLRWAWRRWVTDVYAAKYFKDATSTVA